MYITVYSLPLSIWADTIKIWKVWQLVLESGLSKMKFGSHLIPKEVYKAVNLKIYSKDYMLGVIYRKL